MKVNPTSSPPSQRCPQHDLLEYRLDQLEKRISIDPKVTVALIALIGVLATALGNYLVHLIK